MWSLVPQSGLLLWLSSHLHQWVWRRMASSLWERQFLTGKISLKASFWIGCLKLKESYSQSIYSKTHNSSSTFFGVVQPFRKLRSVSEPVIPDPFLGGCSPSIPLFIPPLSRFLVLLFLQARGFSPRFRWPREGSAFRLPLRSRLLPSLARS